MDGQLLNRVTRHCQTNQQGARDQDSFFPPCASYRLELLGGRKSVCHQRVTIQVCSIPVSKAQDLSGKEK